MIGYYKNLCLLDSGLITPYHAAFPVGSTHSISDELKYIGVGYIYSTGHEGVFYALPERYRFYVCTTPKRIRRKKNLYRDLINALRNTK